MATRQSTVKWFDAKKGYGFIHHPDGGDDVFVHYTQIESEKDFKTLRTGQSVAFEMNDGPKGLHAASVSPLGEDGEETSSDMTSASPPSTDSSPAVGESSLSPSSSHGSSSGASGAADSQPTL